jgi:hypothetical protein
VAVQPTDETCAALNRITQPPDPSALHRFFVGRDSGPSPMSAGDVAALGDPVATLLFAQGRFPQTGEELVDALRRAGGPQLRQMRVFLLGEGSQIPFSAATQDLERNLRFVVAVGADSAPDVIFSTPRPDAHFIELMCWDRVAGGFNFYRTVRGAWIFAGNSRGALAPPTAGKGVWESHVSGNVLMKELRKPWLHWHSPEAAIADTVLAPEDPLRMHDWFLFKGGADVFETTVAMTSIQRWTKTRFDARAEPASRVLRQVLDTMTVNLTSSQTRSGADATSVRVPQNFLVDVDALAEVLGLPAPPDFTIAGPLYAAALDTFDVRLESSGGFRQDGDTHFAFVVPERAFEDIATLRAALGVRLLSARLAACLLMVDFPNPVFSARRASLLAHAPDVPDAQFAQATADAILAAADATPPGSPEREFAGLWAAGDGWRAPFAALLQRYYGAVTARLATRAGVEDVFRLAESRRERVRALPIFENPLLFATTNIAPAQLAMRADATVA